MSLFKNPREDHLEENRLSLLEIPGEDHLSSFESPREDRLSLFGLIVFSLATSTSRISCLQFDINIDNSVYVSKYFDSKDFVVQQWH